MSYAAPIWSLSLSNTNWSKLQVKQNKALRTITGCVKWRILIIYTEKPKFFSVREHNEMVAKQFYLRSHLSGRAGYGVLESESRRILKATLISKYVRLVARLPSSVLAIQLSWIITWTGLTQNCQIYATFVILVPIMYTIYSTFLADRQIWTSSVYGLTPSVYLNSFSSHCTTKLENHSDESSIKTTFK